MRLEVDEVQRTARTLGIEITAFEFGGAEDIAPTIEKLKGKTEALYLTTTPLLTTNRDRLNMSALGARLPTMYGNRDAVEVGHAGIPVRTLAELAAYARRQPDKLAYAAPVFGGLSHLSSCCFSSALGSK